MGELASGDQSNEAAFQEQRPADGLWADWCQGTGKPRPTVVLESGPDPVSESGRTGSYRGRKSNPNSRIWQHTSALKRDFDAVEITDWWH